MLAVSGANWSVPVVAYERYDKNGNKISTHNDLDLRSYPTLALVTSPAEPERSLRALPPLGYSDEYERKIRLSPQADN